jgi:predicted oxidoreductase
VGVDADVIVVGAAGLVATPEQWRLRVRDSADLALAGLAGHGRLRPA